MSRFTTNVSSRPRALGVALTALGILTAAVALGSPAIASAGEQPADGLQTNVFYTQRDLATVKGSRALYRRLENAAAEVCPVSSSLFPDPAAASKECQQRAIARAIGEIGSSRLAAIQAQAVAKRG
ncbi:MAG TPA: UrcA family protein [Steroidobacteraceae bacterium]|jgi:UrcA family protein